MMSEKNEYLRLIAEISPKSHKIKDFVAAFTVGGTICALGELLFHLYSISYEEAESRTLVSVTLIFLTALLTGIGVFDKIAKLAGAGTLVPITGFANAMVSPAVEFKTEGQILGIGVNMFKIAGPVLVFGISAATLWGIIYYIVSLCGATV